MLMNDEPIIIMSHDNRLYTAFCNKCGHSGESETESAHRLICGKCGHDEFRHIRDHNVEKMLFEGRKIKIQKKETIQ